MEKIKIEFEIIGVIHSPYKTRNDAPRQGNSTTCELEIKPEYAQGLTDIQGFSHVHLFYWLHKSKGYNLMVQTPWDIKPHGLFTTRSPHRPNPIGYTVAEIVKRKNNVITVKNLDAIDGTPLIDIKPYIKKIDMKQDAVSGWLNNTDIDL